MTKKECIAMILAGGQGSRLGILTRTIAKPAIPFGGKYRIIDFTLSNCINSGIDTVGVLTQYLPLELNAYIGNGQPWDLDRNTGGVSILPPFVKGKAGEWYKGTANAIYQNEVFINRHQPEYVVILSGDHIYKMDYSKMLSEHKAKGADCTIAVIEVPIEEASRFGIMNTDETGAITQFEEKPKKPKSNTASMGVYVFTWEKLRYYLQKDEENKSSSHDFGKDVIPAMLAGGESVYAYKFKGYWKDVGTVESLWQANMDLVKKYPQLNLHDPAWRIYGKNPIEPPHYVSADAVIKNALITEGAEIYGRVENSVVFYGVRIGKGAVVNQSIIMPNAIIEEDAVVEYAIVAEGAHITRGQRVGGDQSPTEICVV
jgi:glucose-1-phosphate adenylyltransferase